MKKVITYFNLFLLLSLSAFQAQSQADCHALFSSHQTEKTLTINFTDLSTSPHTITSWLWDFGDGNTSTSQNPSYTYTHEGTYYVCLTIQIGHGCSSTSCQHVTVNPVIAPCHAMFSFHQIDNTLTINFTDLSTSSNTISSWQWDFGDGEISNSENPDHTYAHDGTYNVCLTIQDEHGCSNTYCHHFVVSALAAPCHAGYTLYADSTGNTIHFTNISTGTTASTTYSWDFGDGSKSSDENPEHTYAQTGHYTVCLIIHDETTGCSSHFCHELNTHHGGNHFHNMGEYSTLQTQPTSGLTSKDNQYIVNYPNPVKTSTTIQYELVNEAEVTIEIYDFMGYRKDFVINEKESKGLHSQLINTNEFNSGFYLVKIIVGGVTYNHKINVLR